MKRTIRRHIRLLQLWALVSTGVVIGFVAAGLTSAQAQGTRFDEISVERINIVERDGRVRLVLANSARQADAVVDGRVLAAGRNRPAGMIFFNDVGDEVGGLLFSGRPQDNAHRATASLTFDQWKQDQTIALQYVDQNGQRRAGLAVIDRPDTSIGTLFDLSENVGRQRPTRIVPRSTVRSLRSVPRAYRACSSARTSMDTPRSCSLTLRAGKGSC